MGDEGYEQGRGSERGIGPTELRAALASPDAARRAWAIQSARPDPAFEPILVLSLVDPSPGVRIASIHALARIVGSRGVRALIRAAAQDPSPSVRAEAMTALGSIVEIRSAPEGGPDARVNEGG